jgi:thymidylate synthase (FAD)
MSKSILDSKQSREIQELAEISNHTKRATVLEMEDILYKPFPVLDHGFIRVIDYMGDDAAVVQAARVSYGKGTKKVNEDRGLINYLMRHRHSTPFEMCEVKLHIKLPMFVARQWVRHRTANINEYSARYSILDREFYIPAPQHLASQSNTNHQGREGVIEGDYANKILQILKDDASNAYDHYEYLLNESGEDSRPGLARELARMNLPVNFYTQWYWKIDLHNFMHFLSLRADPHAQYEIKAYADILLEEVLKRWMPITYEAFKNYKVDGVHLSSKAMEVIKKMTKGEKVEMEQSGLGKREWQELIDLLQ